MSLDSRTGSVPQVPSPYQRGGLEPALSEVEGVGFKMHIMTRKLSPVVVIGDAILLLAFAYGGEVSHELYFPDSIVLSVLHAALPFALVWFPVAFLLGALGDPRAARPIDVLARGFEAWLVAAPLAIVVRGWLINRAVIPIAFLIVTYVLGLTFLLGWRILLIAFVRPGQRRSNESN